jgi:cytochrome P450
MTEVTGQMLDKWAEQAEREEALDVADEMIKLALEVVGRTLFSVDLAMEVETVRKAFSGITRQFRQLSSHPLGVYFGLWLLNFRFLPGTRRFQQNAALLDEVVQGIIAKRREARRRDREKKNDLLALLMDARDEETGRGMSERQLLDEVLTIMLTGHETVAVALTAIFALLSMHPQVRAKVEREVDAALADRPPKVDDIKSLRYTTMVIEESLRLYPPIYATSRTALTADRIGDYAVDADAIVTLSPYLTHRHPYFWQEPHKFDPGRFSPERRQQRHRYAFIPFGCGARMCIGSNFAMTEIKLVLAMVIRRFRLNLAPGKRLEMKPLITLHPHDGLLMMVRPR